jgi:hypothetical protein
MAQKRLEIKQHLKIKLFNVCVKSVLLYGCETWFVTNNIMQNLQAFVNRCLRNIIGIWWSKIISNEELWERTGQSKIDVEIKRRKYGWIKHTLRKSQNEICHGVLEWNPQGRRSRGRPKATWKRTVLANYELKPETAIDGSWRRMAYAPMDFQGQ